MVFSFAVRIQPDVSILFIIIFSDKLMAQQSTIYQTCA